jgi:hypothetical protein
MTEKQRSASSYCKSAKSQTFYRGDEFYDVVLWIMENIETDNKGSTGCKLSKKYAIAVKVLNDRTRDYSKK